MVVALPLWAAQPEIAGLPRIIDGDTLEVAGQRIRLGGIDAPEMREQCQDGAGQEWPCGVWAKDAAEAMLAGRNLRCVDLGQQSYNRIVGRCYLNGRDIAIDLIEAGAARVCLRFAREQGQEQTYLRAEERAVKARAGVYSGPLNPVAGFCGVAERQMAEVTPPSQACAIKGNVSANGQIYHLPGQRHYDQVTMRGGETRWFCTESQAQAAGWRRALR